MRILLPVRDGRRSRATDPGTDREAWADALRKLVSDDTEREGLRQLGLRRAALFRLEAAREYVRSYRETIGAESTEA